ncbi:MAG: hypothetical protein R2828_01330 [Saprospiraceae bacterium]
MRKAIWIFVSRNEKPDLYINIISHFLNRFGKDIVNKAVLVKIIDSSIEKDRELTNLLTLKGNITRQIDSLSNSQYLLWDWKIKQFKNLDSPQNVIIKEDWLKIYRAFQEFLKVGMIETKTILEENIEVQLSSIIVDNSDDLIFDVTGVITRHMLRVSLVLLSKKKGIYAFEMHKPLVHNDEDLIHNLLSNDFDYHKLNVNKYVVISPPDNISINDVGSSTLQNTNKVEERKRMIKEVSKGNPEKIINKILEAEELDDHLKEKVALIGGRYSHISKHLSIGRINYEEYKKELYSINYDLINIINDL